MQESLKTWKLLSKVWQLRFSHSLQDVYNGIGIVLANREDNAEALPYLESSIEAYKSAIAACETEDKSAIFADF